MTAGDIIHATISDAAASMGLVADRVLTRADVEQMVADNNAADWGPSIASLHDELVSWDDATGAVISRTVVLAPNLPTDVRLRLA